MDFELVFRRRNVVAALMSFAALAVLFTMPQLLGDVVRDGFAGLDAASPAWLWVAGAAFAISLVAGACAWRTALIACGAKTSVADSSARYTTGSLCNTFLPGHVGSAVRIGLYGRTLTGEGRMWAAGGVATVVSVLRFVALGVLLAVASVSGMLPRWPLFAIGAAGLAVVVVALVARRHKPGRRVGHVLDAFAVLGSSPTVAFRILGWHAVVMATRVVAAASVCTALGIERPLIAALLIVPAVELAGALPLTPANIGVTSAAVAFALSAHGMGTDVAVSAGIAFHAVETSIGIVGGTAGALFLAHVPIGFRRWAIPATAACACFLVGGAFGATVLAPLV